MSPQHMTRVMRNWHWLLFFGLGLLAFGLWNARCLGFASGLMLVLFGALAWSFHLTYRERGIWMLGVLALLAFAPLYGALEYECYKMHHNPQQPTFYLRLADTMIGANVVWQAVRFLASVTWLNWKWSKHEAHTHQGDFASYGTATDRPRD
jgi:hypothetical protein